MTEEVGSSGTTQVEAGPTAGPSPTVQAASPEAVAAASGSNGDSVEGPTGSSSALAESSAAPAPSGSPPVPPALSQRPPADRLPARAGEAEKITFEDLNLGMQADVVFRPFMLTDRVRDLDGKRVSIAGYMYGGVSATRGIKEFILLRNKECKFGPGGQADHLAQVFIKPGRTTDYTPAPVKVEAILKVEPFQGPDGNTWSIYRLEDAEIR